MMVSRLPLESIANFLNSEIQSVFRSLTKIPVDSKSVAMNPSSAELYGLETLYLAYSGGIDSSVLLHALQTCADRHRIVVWHINHGLQDNALEMERFARQQAQRYGLAFRLDRLELGTGANLEARARLRRYALFARALQSTDVLLTAHHQNDQAETLLLNLMRGSGSAGLRGIAWQKKLGQGVLLRPLLNVPRSLIEAYASQQAVQWIDDPSNADDHFDRNYLRHEILPRLSARWPAATAQLQRVSELQQESEQIHQALARIDYQAIWRSSRFSAAGCLDIRTLCELSQARQKNLLRYWIVNAGYRAPGYHRLQQVLQQLQARQDAMPLVQMEDYSLRSYQQSLYLLSSSETEPVRNLAEIYPVPSEKNLQITTLGLDVSRADIFTRLQQVDTGQTLELRFRKKSATAQSHSHRLKRLFQSHRIPPWMRDKTPQILLDGELLGLLF